jgi:hypothetical protein
MSLEVMTPQNLRWKSFADALYRAMEWNENGWKCDGNLNEAERPERVHRYAKAVLASMGGVDIKKSLAFFEEHGGGCDCEILFNVDPEGKSVSITPDTVA